MVRFSNTNNAQDYYPYGMLMPGRSYSSTAYKYGFNGQEKDDEVYGAGNLNTAMFWEYDARLGRRWNIDPVLQADVSSYACFNNNPILFNDPNGDTPKEGDKNNNASEGQIDECGQLTYHCGTKTNGYKDEGWMSNDKYEQKVQNYADAIYRKQYNSNRFAEYSSSYRTSGDEQIISNSFDRNSQQSRSFITYFEHAWRNAEYSSSQYFQMGGYGNIDISPVDPLDIAAGFLTLAKYGISRASLKMIGTAQSTGTIGHKLTSNILAWRWALDPRVETVTLDLGMKNLGYTGFKWGIRPDVGVRFFDGRGMAIEVISHTQTIEMMSDKLLRFNTKYELGFIPKVYKPLFLFNPIKKF